METTKAAKADNEIFVSKDSKIGATLKYVWGLIVKEKKFDTVVLKARG